MFICVTLCRVCFPKALTVSKGSMLPLKRISKFDIKVCDSAEDAWKIFRTGYKADLIVLDLVLPGQSGKSFLTELKKQKALADIPVIVLSGNDKSNTRIDMLKAGADDFIIKPFNPEELEIKIAKITSKIEKINVDSRINP